MKPPAPDVTPILAAIESARLRMIPLKGVDLACAAVEEMKKIIIAKDYQTSSGKVRAIVRRVHRDGDRTVEAQHYLDAEGKETGPYLGFKFRVDPVTLAPFEPIF